jgi:AcrR family transcriptional regulator
LKKSIPKRSYNQTARAEGAAETRRRIIDVTRDLLTRAPLESVSLPAIAAKADVARSTVYTIFGSREGLMVAVAEDLLDRGGFGRIGEALRGPDVVRAFKSTR